MFIDSNIHKIWFTSDTHFGHKNVISYCNRPFENVDDMNNGLVANWNNNVGKHDIVFHIGDFCFMKDPREILNSLNGNIYIVPGNHDSDDFKKIIHSEFTRITMMPSIVDVDIMVEDEKLRFVLCHYAMRVWNKSHYGAIHLYGHSHGTLIDDPKSRSMDVGVDCTNYTPISIDDVLLKMYRKAFIPVDHHGEK